MNFAAIREGICNGEPPDAVLTVGSILHRLVKREFRAGLKGGVARDGIFVQVQLPSWAYLRYNQNRV